MEKLPLVFQDVGENLLGDHVGVLHHFEVEDIGECSYHDEDSLDDVAFGLLKHSRGGVVDQLVEAIECRVFVWQIVVVLALEGIDFDVIGVLDHDNL
jgi:hypothetical protein